jgi:hypothetical protein
VLEPQFITELNQAKSVLIAGAGGGFDVFCGLPLYFALKERGIAVHLANLSFSFRHGDITGERIGKDIVRVTARSTGNEYYFPEGYLAQWLCRKNIDAPIYCLRPAGPKVLAHNYRLLLERLKFDTVVLVDGGVDSILRGDEAQLGTPVEDMCSIAAVHDLAVPHKQVMCLGFGAETDVCHASALETLAGLIRSKAFLGSLALTIDMPEVQQFVEATEFVFHEMRGYESVICSSVIAALHGNYGDHHRTKRTLGSQLWINPMMIFYWAFSLQRVMENVLYIESIREKETLDQVNQVIKDFRSATKTRAITPFPITASNNE